METLKTGFLATRPKILLLLCHNSGSLKRQVGQKNSQAWNDEQVLVYHCFDRLFNFKYVGIIDLDEFIVPHKDRNFEQLFVCVYFLQSKYALCSTCLFV